MRKTLPLESIMKGPKGPNRKGGNEMEAELRDIICANADSCRECGIKKSCKNMKAYREAKWIKTACEGTDKCEECPYGVEDEDRYICMFKNTGVFDWPYSDLSEECNKNRVCEECLFYECGCGLSGKPFKWNI